MHPAEGLRWPHPRGSASHPGQGPQLTCSLSREKLSSEIHTLTPASPLSKELMASVSGLPFHPQGATGALAAQ